VRSLEIRTDLHEKVLRDGIGALPGLTARLVRIAFRFSPLDFTAPA